MDSGDFSYHDGKDEKVFIAWRGRWVLTLRGIEAARFRQRIAGLDRFAAQSLMARATGNFKRGNERAAKDLRRQPPAPAHARAAADRCSL